MMLQISRCGFAPLVVILLFFWACTDQRQTKDTSHIIIDHVTLLDGRGGAPLIDARVEIRDDRIIAVTSVRGKDAGNAIRIDGRGKFLLPGFIDMHAHLLFPRCSNEEESTQFDRILSKRALAQQLDFGITTIRSPANPTEDGLRLRDDLNAGIVRGPRAYAAAELINDVALDEQGLRKAVRELLPARPDYIKVYAQMRPEQVAILADEAHRNRLPVIGHLQRTSWTQGLERGVDHFAHSVDWAVESLPPDAQSSYRMAQASRGGFRSRIDWLEAFDPQSEQMGALLSELARLRVSVDVTLIAYDGKFSSKSDPRYRSNPHLGAFPELTSDWETCDGAVSDWTADDYRRWKVVWPKLLNWVKQMHDAGVLLVSGTDLTNEWVTPGDGLHQEFELLASAGLSPRDILKMTGANAAEALNSNDVGIIEVGRRADLVLLSADPFQSISNTRSIIWVMQGGKIVSRGPGGADAQSFSPLENSDPSRR